MFYQGGQIVKLDVSIKLNLKTAEVTKAVKDAARLAMRDTVEAVATEAQRNSPVITGNNRRLIKSEVSGMGANEVVDPAKIQGAVFSTSGYGGILEVGSAPHLITVKNAKVLTDGKIFFGKTVHHPGTKPHPYFKPALDKEFTAEKFTEAMKRHLK